MAIFSLYTTREIVNTFFEDVPKNTKGEHTNFKFKCSCGTTRTQDLKKGLTNLISHTMVAAFLQKMITDEQKQ